MYVIARSASSTSLCELYGRHQRTHFPAAEEKLKRSLLLSPKTAPVAICQIHLCHHLSLSAEISHQVGTVRKRNDPPVKAVQGTQHKPHWKDSESEAQAAVMECCHSLAQSSRHCEQTSVAFMLPYMVGQSWRHGIVYKMPLPRL